ncbi:sulfur carrier protein ThiS [Halobacillus litoralis]|uniref:sulfur carrier protein ThiS n=1 Tax=Halobacillus litoralis TaxID=45668 RepID=UPI001CD2DA32|nr:sulfur carrier protein ThiS [Halobacillus litoralis]MCA1023611.1 sulfur carrier protein ThiS [Halobacillus litoralis]
MNVKINGEWHEIPDHLADVRTLLGHFQLDNRVVIVELNDTILEKSEHADSQVHEGDQMELVQFVGGG